MVPIRGNVITSLTSNVHDDDSCYYFSDRNQLLCLNHDFSAIWRHEFPARTAAHAQLTTRGDTLLMLNEGYGMRGMARVDAGKPFMAAYNKHTGEQLSLNMLPDKWDEKVWGKMLHFAADTLYLLNAADTTFSPIVVAPDRYPLYDVDGNVCMVNSKLEVAETYGRMLVYTKGSSHRNYCIMGQWGKAPDFYLINNHGKAVAHYGKPAIDVHFSEGKVVVLSEGKMEWTEIE